jgi:hypothetical protein
LAINRSYLETPQPTTILTDKVTEAKVSKILEKNIFEPPPPFNDGVSVSVAAGSVILSGF